TRGLIPLKDHVDRRRQAVLQGLQERTATGAGRSRSHGTLPFTGGLRDGEVTPFPARRPSAGAVPGRRGACLAVRTPPAAFVFRVRNQESGIRSVGPFCMSPFLVVRRSSEREALPGGLRRFDRALAVAGETLNPAKLGWRPRSGAG